MNLNVKNLHFFSLFALLHVAYGIIVYRDENQEVERRFDPALHTTGVDKSCHVDLVLVHCREVQQSLAADQK